MNSFSEKRRVSDQDKKSLGIRGRLFLGFGLITFVLIVAIFTTLILIRIPQNFTKSMVINDLPTYDYLILLNSEIYKAQGNVRAYLLTNESNFMDEWRHNWEQITEIQRKMDDLATIWTSKEDISDWENLKPLLSQLRLLQEKALNANDKNQSINIFKTELTPVIHRALNILEGNESGEGIRKGGMFRTQYFDLKADAISIQQTLNNLSYILYVILIFSILLCIVITYLTFRSIIKPINQFREHSHGIASGNLRRHLNIDRNDELGKLGQDLNNMTQSLSNVTKQIIESCHNITTTINEVKKAVNSQSTGATQQAASVNEITASLEEIEKSSTQTIEKAKTLGDAANRTKVQGQSGLESVEQSLDRMHSVGAKVEDIAKTVLELSNKSQQVGEITLAVSTIAQQSKMLALNASIEAAKAGEAGKGFAVVATEVKNLAEQSEQSTTQIQKILEDIKSSTENAVIVTEEGTKEVDKGLSSVEQTGEHVKSLVDMIHETVKATQQIEAAIRQESIGIDQITTGMNEINQVTHTFVESVNQTVQAIDELSNIVKNLQKTIEVYKI